MQLSGSPMHVYCKNSTGGLIDFWSICMYPWYQYTKLAN